MTTYTLNQLQLDGLILNCGSAVGKEMLRNLQPNTQEPIMWRTDKRLNGRYTHADQSKIPTFNVAPGVDWVPLHTQPAPQANTQEPVAWMQTDCIGERFLTFDEPYQPSPLKDKVEPLFTHPAPQQTQEPRKDTVFGGPKAREQMLNQLVHPAPQQVAGLLATDDFYSWWGENPSLGQQQALVQFYDKQPAQQAKPLTDAFAKAASEHGLTLVITTDGYKLMKCGPASLHK